MRQMTYDSVVRTVQGCDGYSMDLAECAEHYGVTVDALRQFVADTASPWLIILKDDDGDEYIALDGE
jgi:hypothetical protein